MKKEYWKERFNLIDKWIDEISEGRIDDVSMQGSMPYGCFQISENLDIDDGFLTEFIKKFEIAKRSCLFANSQFSLVNQSFTKENLSSYPYSIRRAFFDADCFYCIQVVYDDSPFHLGNEYRIQSSIIPLVEFKLHRSNLLKANNG